MFDYQDAIKFIRTQFPSKEVIPLHEPKFQGNEKKFIIDSIDSTFVSSVGPYVDRFEQIMAEVSETGNAVAIVNGTAGIQVALRLAGVKAGEEVITQSLTFVATANAIIYNNAIPVFVDVDLDTMGLSPTAVDLFLKEFAEIREDGFAYNKKSGRRIAAIMPMHTFGFPVHLDKLTELCNKWNIPMVEDAAESMGSKYKGKSTGSFGLLGVFSFNGNKIVTSGGGGAIVSKNQTLAKKGKHLTTTAKIPHPFEYAHDEIGYNYRMPNLNAALACAQMEQLNEFVENKRFLAHQYAEFFTKKGIFFRKELPESQANYWLMCIQMENRVDRDLFLKATNEHKIMTRPIWQLMFRSPFFASYQRDNQKNSCFLEERIVNIPSSVR